MKNIALKILIIVFLLSACLASAGKAIAQTSPLDAEGYYNLGDDRLKSSRWQEAMEAFKQAIKLKPDFAEAHFSLGVAYHCLDRYQEAIDAYKQAIRLKPEYAYAHGNLGTAYNNLGRYEEALEAYKQAVTLKPNYTSALQGLGQHYLILGHYEEAIKAYKQAIKLKPDDADAHNSLGVAYKQLGRNQEAIDAYKQAIKLKPDYANAHNNLGIAYLEIGNKASALEEYKILKNLDPESANSLFNRIASAEKAIAQAAPLKVSGWDAILPQNPTARYVKKDVLQDSADMNNTLIELDISKKKALAYYRDELVKAGWRLDKALGADSEKGVLGKPALWGILNVVKDPLTLTMIILSDQKSGTNKTRIDVTLINRKPGQRIAADLSVLLKNITQARKIAVSPIWKIDDPVVAMASDGKEILYVASSKGDIFKLVKNAKPVKIFSKIEECGFSTLAMSVLQDGNIAVNGCVDNKDVIYLLDKNGNKNEFMRLEKNVLSLDVTPQGRLIAGLWSSVGNISMNLQPRYMQGAESLSGTIAELEKDKPLKTLYTGGLPMDLCASESGTIYASVWGNEGELRPARKNYTIADPMHLFWIGLSDNTRILSSPFISDDKKEKTWTDKLDALSRICMADNETLFGYGISKKGEAGFYVLRAEKEPVKILLNDDKLHNDVTCMAVFQNTIYFANTSGQIYRLGQ